jgi:asparagine synthase (glutamine-hydrolysing)
MCGISGIFGKSWQRSQLAAMVAAQRHRGPDADAVWVSPDRAAGFGHNRLSIIDLSPAGRQPMFSPDGNLAIVFNGEVYNYRELREELSEYPYRSRTDTEVVLAAWQRWGEACLDRLIGMFAFLIWDAEQRTLFAARDRFGVKPVNYHLRADGTLYVASEIRALHAAGVPAAPDPSTWADYLACGMLDHSGRTFWAGIRTLPPGHSMTWRDGRLRIRCWYDVAERAGTEFDPRPSAVVEDEYLALLEQSVALRFRSDVPVGINLSGGLDSSILLGLVDAVQGPENNVKAFTYITGDERYDELPWVRQMLAKTHHPAVICELRPEDVPVLAASVQAHESEPFGGMPTLAYALVHERARADGIIVLLDGQGMDEQWAGYDYYSAELDGRPAGLVQGTGTSPIRPECLTPEFRALAKQLDVPRPFPDRLRNRQYRDARYTKIPRALRFNDRISMRASTELREPFLDHRLFECALRQPPERKISGGVRKRLLRDIVRRLLPVGVVEAPKRPVQTPQREWLAGPLREWAAAHIETALSEFQGEWFDAHAVRKAWNGYLAGGSDNSYYVWQWISLGLTLDNVLAVSNHE